METKKERSVGSIIFRRENDKILFLVLYKINKDNSFWDFPKGHVEEGETDYETLSREVAEETSLHRINVLPNFHVTLRYRFERGGQAIDKTVLLYLAETEESDVNISDEHTKHHWGSYHEVSELLKFEDQKRALDAAEEFIEKSE